MNRLMLEIKVQIKKYPSSSLNKVALSNKTKYQGEIQLSKVIHL